MFIIWGAHSELKDLGVVAELCPRCGVVSASRVVGHVQGLHVFFLPMAASVTEAVATCGRCGEQFLCESWRYKAILPFAEAFSLPLETLLARTNPALKERLEWSRQRAEFSADPRFEEALRSVEELRPGSLKTRLTKDLRRWDQLDEGRREELVREASGLVVAMKFAVSIGAQIPGNAGCATGLVTCLAVWGALFLVPGLWNNGVIIGAFGVLAGPMIGGMVYQLLVNRRVRRWTREVLVEEGRKSGVDFQQFTALLGDLPPPSSRSRDLLTPLQEQAATILMELSIFEKMNQDIRMWDRA